MGRIDNLSETELPVTLDRLTADLNELKSRQFIGTDNLEIQVITTGAPGYDVNGDALAAFGQKRYRVTFTPNTAKSAYAELTYVANLVGNSGFETVDYYPDPDNSSTDAFRSWIIVVTAQATALTVFIAFRVKCIDTGVLTWVAL